MSGVWIRRVLWAIATGTTLVSCAAQDTHMPVQDVLVQEVRGGLGTGRNFLSVDLLVTDQAGQLVDCGVGDLDISVSVARSAQGPFAALPSGNLQVQCTSNEAPNMALVVDNSGSEDGFLPWLKQAAHVMVNTIAAEGGRASLVRVSTDSAVKLTLTDDAQALRNGIDALYINDGWTALFDGIRMGNETLGGALGGATTHSNLASFCESDSKMGIVVFSDGNENNSANERLRSAEYPGDGLGTSLEDLHNLHVNNVRTPIYTVGLGADVDHGGLSELAEFTGGRHYRVDDAGDLPGVFQVISDYASGNTKVCGEVPPDTCGEVHVRVNYEWKPCADDDVNCAAGQEPLTGTQTQTIYLPCPGEPATGNAATILLTLSNPGLARDVAKTLAANTVAWVSPVPAPRVLIVADDNHHNEFTGDPGYVQSLLTEEGYDVSLLAEPPHGISDADVAGFDVVWISNPGYPIDDHATLATLTSFAASGGGYVLQGDDMTWFWGDSAFSMTPFTGASNYNNGTYFCDYPIDNNSSAYSYQVSLNSDTHPVISGIEGTVFPYGNDIDGSSPAELGEQVLAWAGGIDASGNALCAHRVPVILVRTP